MLSLLWGIEGLRSASFPGIRQITHPIRFCRPWAWVANEGPCREITNGCYNECHALAEFCSRSPCSPHSGGHHGCTAPCHHHRYSPSLFHPVTQKPLAKIQILCRTPALQQERKQTKKHTSTNAITHKKLSQGPKPYNS